MFHTTLRERRWRPAATRMAIASGVAVACAAGTMVGVAVASPAATPKAASPAAANPRPIDHHLCYTVTHGQYTIPPAVELFNQFSPHGFVPRINPVPAIHCNPVKKIIVNSAGGNKVFPIKNPAAHLLCFRMAAAKPQPTPKVIVRNQFGSAELLPSQPNLLCLPSWKGLHGPPHRKLPQPPGLSHFTCYPVKELPGTGGYKPPPGVLLQDEFASTPTQVQVSAIPQELCLPTEKTVGTKVTKIVNRAAHLLCFGVRPTPRKPRVWDQNQFGTSAIAIGRTRWLCLPSTKVLVPPPVDHHLCYVAKATFPIPAGVELFNQFAPRGFRPKIGAVAFHCNPVVKIIANPVGNQVFPITNPAAHLLCFRMAAARQAAHEVQVTNQFGAGLLITGQPNLLCLPSWKGIKKQPNMKVPQPPGLSHFTCYPVKEVAGTTTGYKPPPLMLQDQFAPKAVPAQVNPVPQELCLPTKKVIGKKVFPIVNAVAHLLCFHVSVSPTPIISSVIDQNQFGTGSVTIVRTRWLCLPSTKKVIK